MSKTISFKGQLQDGTQDRIRLKTLQGKIGYRITKFHCISEAPASTTAELVCKIFKTNQTGLIDPLIDFTNADLLAINYNEEHSNSTDYGGTKIIFDNEVFNQDIFVTSFDGSGGSQACNYYIELEAMDLSEIETTQLTLKSLRTITSR
jgi:hypothetical protein